MAVPIILTKVFQASNEGKKSYLTESVLVAWGRGCIVEPVAHRKDDTFPFGENYNDNREWVPASSPAQSVIKIGKERFHIIENLAEVDAAVTNKLIQLNPKP